MIPTSFWETVFGKICFQPDFHGLRLFLVRDGCFAQVQLDQSKRAVFLLLLIAVPVDVLVELFFIPALDEPFPNTELIQHQTFPPGQIPCL